MDEIAAVQIVEKVGGNYVLNEDALKRILVQKDVMDRKVAIVTVAGAFRKGKSFLLSNCVRYLQCKRDGTDWMDPDASISGFAWKRSIPSVTEGILMWPEPFIAVDRNGEEYAVLLMDTEGAFDHESSMSQCATIFALAALLSSVLVYNVMQDIQEDTLQHLQFFASYGSYALDEEDSTSPFQSLLFLVRDWQNSDEFGIEAGRRLLAEKFKSHARSNASMRTLRKNIERSFHDMKCFLLPSPGRKITRGSEGEITVNDMDPEFQDGLRELVPRVFGTLLLQKEIGGTQITGAEFFAFFKTYAKIFASGEVPEPKSIYDATAEATHQAALDLSFEHYMTAMKESFAELSDTQFFEESKILSIHQDATAAAARLFEDARKMGSLPLFLTALNDKIEAQYRAVYLKDNQNRVTVARVKKEREEAEKRRLEQEQKAREERIRYEREQEVFRLQVAKEQREREEAEKRLVEQEKKAREERIRHETEQEVLRLQVAKEKREREEAEKRRKEEREREQMEREIAEQRRMTEEKRREEQLQNEREEYERQRRIEQLLEQERMRQMERERRRQEQEAEELRRRMEQLELQNERKEKEREEERCREKREQEERRAREEERERQQRSYTPSYNPYNSGYSSSGYDNFSPSYSNASRSGTPSGRSPGRPKGSTAERYAQGIMPGTQGGWDLLQRQGYL